MKTILIVEDELVHAELMSIILEQEGYRVFLAANGRDGVARAMQVEPDLVILDFLMPLMNGAEVGRALRSASAGGPRILMNSSLPEATVREHFDRYDAFLRKPYNIDTALGVIRRLLETR